MSGLPFLSSGEDVPCMELDPESFFPTAGQPHGGALAACAGCWAQPDCAEYGIRHDYLDGVWGGLGETARRRIRRERDLPSLKQNYETAVWSTGPNRSTEVA